VALRLADDRLLVGPDNGVLSLAAQRGGGVIEAVDIARSPFRLEPVSATFHGRDVFAPVTARLACGDPLAAAGVPLDPDELVRIDLPHAHLKDGALVAHVVYVDRFGNLQLDVEHEELPRLGLRLGRGVELKSGSAGAKPAHFVRTFADVHPGDLLLYEDSYRRLAVAVSHGDAAEHLRLGAGDELRIRPE
jgi:S-adenosylmethionine hydrolase